MPAPRRPAAGATPWNPAPAGAFPPECAGVAARPGAIAAGALAAGTASPPRAVAPGAASPSRTVAPDVASPPCTVATDDDANLHAAAAHPTDAEHQPTSPFPLHRRSTDLDPLYTFEPAGAWPHEHQFVAQLGGQLLDAAHDHAQRCVRAELGAAQLPGAQQLRLDSGQQFRNVAAGAERDRRLGAVDLEFFA